MPPLYRRRRRSGDERGYGWEDVPWFGSGGRGRAMPVLVVDDFAVPEKEKRVMFDQE